MRILLTGASGFIGGTLLRALRARGHEVRCAGRRPPPQPHDGWHAVDFTQAVEASHWLPLLHDVDAVINAVGLLREQGAQTFERLHTRAPVALFEACATAGVARVIQVSALGADDHAVSRYHRSKRAADRCLLALPLAGTVLQPSVVFGPGGSSTRLFMTLASLPVLPLPGGGRQALQPVHVDDVAAVVLALLDAPPARAGQVLPLVGPQPLTLADYLRALRAQLGLPAAPAVSMPGWLMRLAARAGDHLPGLLLDSESWQMLERGNTATADEARPAWALLGRPPRAVAGFVPPSQAAAERAQAVLAWALPALRVALALVWLATAAVSFGLYPVADSFALLARVGVPPAWQPLLLYGAAGLDALLGVLTVAPLRPGARRTLWLSQALLVLGYTALITWRLPEFWLHPYGPLTKNLPLLALLLLLYALEPAGRTDRPPPER
jgi:uncharacterized protein YbjT (DUF2867 family)